MRDTMNGFWIRGYTQAIMDMQEQFNGVVFDLGHYKKRPTEKLFQSFLKTFLDNRANLREQRGFLRYNKLLDDIEYYEPRGE